MRAGYNASSLAEAGNTSSPGPISYSTNQTVFRTLSISRLATTPSPELKVLLQRMRLLLPNRPKLIENVVQKNAPPSA